MLADMLPRGATQSRPHPRVFEQPNKLAQQSVLIEEIYQHPVSPLRMTSRTGAVSLATMAVPALIASIRLQLSTNGYVR